MRDFDIKLGKFIKAKIASDKKTRMSTPHVTYGVTVASPSVTTGTKQVSRNISMTVSFYNPRFEKPYPKDYAIKHENVKQKNIEASSPSRVKSPKRDPILQNNNEPVKDFKSTIKISELSNKMTLFTEEPVVRMRSQGECRTIQQARSASPTPKAEGIRLSFTRTNISPYKEHSPDQKRLRKEVKTAHISRFNPITEGDPEGVKPKKEKPQYQPSDALKKVNDRKFIIGSELGASPKGKVFRDTKIVLGEYPPETDTTPKKVGGIRVSSPQGKRDGAKGLLEYEYSLPFRDQGVTNKCNNLRFSDVVKPVGC